MLQMQRKSHAGTAIITAKRKNKSAEGVALMKLIKNLEHETAALLRGQVQVLPGQIVSKTLAQNESVSITLFAFSEGEEIGTHDSEGDAMVLVLEGTGEFTVDGKKLTAGPGEFLIMPRKKPHSVSAPENFKMMLTAVFPQGEQAGE
jgi:quercetin dioxygenase-like cupin family protein